MAIPASVKGTVRIWPTFPIKFKDRYGGTVGNFVETPPPGFGDLDNLGAIRMAIDAFHRTAGISLAEANRRVAELLLEEADRLETQGTEAGLTREQREGIRKLGLDPERVVAMTDDTNYADWKKLKTAEGGK